jgi:hypothetical protein
MGMLFKLLGGQFDQVVRIEHADLRFGGIPLPWLLILAMLLVAATLYSYRGVTPLIAEKKRYILIGLRITFFMLLLLFLGRPVLTLTITKSIRRTLLFVMDTSKSMSIADARLDKNDAVRAGMISGALDPGMGLDQPAPNPAPRPARLQMAKAALSNPQLNWVADLDRDFDLEGYRFADGVAPFPIINSASVNVAGDRTAIGDCIRDLIRQKRGQALAGIVLMTDGGNNAGASPTDAATLAAAQKTQIYTYGIGVTNPRDISVASIFAEHVGFAKEEMPVSARIRSQGYAGQTVTVEFRLGNKIVATRDITFDGDGETLVSARFTPDTPGEFDLTASVPAREDEAVKDNNSASQRLRVIDGKIKVLYIDAEPRWDFKYLQTMLLRDRRIDAKFVLTDADPGLSQGPNSPYLKSIPTDRAKLLAYNMILIGDLPPTALSADQQQILDDFVSKLGGAMIFLAGEKHDPSQYVGTKLEKLLPVIPGNNDAGDSDFSKPIQLQLTTEGASQPMLSLAGDPVESARRWAAMPPVYWTAPVVRLKPGAQALLSGDGGAPVVAIQAYGLGQVLFIGTDETWRWRKNDLLPLHDRLWSQIIQRLGLPNLLGLSQRVQLTSDKDDYFTGDHALIYARIYDENFRPVSADSIEGSFTSDHGAAGSFTLSPVPGQAGLFTSDLVAPGAGRYEISLPRSPGQKLEFDVKEPALEMGETAMNETLLKQIASLSGGTFMREEDLHKLPGLLRAKPAEVTTTLEADVWASPLLFLLMFVAACGEWLLRKQSQLK